MCPNDEDELINALKSGNIITITPVQSEKSKELDQSPNILLNFDIPFYEYNLPIGIDFSKAISPDLYLLSSELIDFIGRLPLISQELRYEFEGLKNFLILGNIAGYMDRLNFLFEKLKITKINPDSPFGSLEIQSCVNLIAGLCHIYQDQYNNLQFLSQKDFISLISDIVNIREKIREFQDSVHITATQVYFLFLLRIFLQWIQKNAKSEDISLYFSELYVKPFTVFTPTFILSHIQSKISHPIIFQKENDNENVNVKKKGSKKPQLSLESAEEFDRPNDLVCLDAILILSCLIQEERKK
jgi:hypothetical protein